jgi:hypothetical protein
MLTWSAIFLSIVVVGLSIVQDWLVYKHRGRSQPDDARDPNPPVITGPQDAGAQRTLDLSHQEKSDKRIQKE